MAETLRGGLSLGVSGVGFWSHDIGGFEGTPDAGLFKRWIALGLLSSHSRLHGSNSYRVPWLFDEESVDVLRTFTRLKLRLMPYLFAAARQAQTEGVPMMRAMAVEFPDDPACTHLERQYLLGDDLLVAPVLAAGPKVTFYVPDGVWTHFLTGVEVTGPGWVTERHGFGSVPLLVRPGSVVPVGARHDRPDYDYADGVTLRVYRLGDGAAVSTGIPGPDGATVARFVTSRTGDRLRVRADSPSPWQVLLVGADGEPMDGATAEPHEQGLLLTPAPGTSVLEATLAR
jgi:alpha-D-xyloside xylohydrolase